MIQLPVNGHVTNLVSTTAIRTTVRLLINVMLFLGACNVAQSATYYVDQTNGNNSNNGTSPSSPWRTVPGMAGHSGPGSLSPGDNVYFDSADTWDVGGGSWGFYLVGGVSYIGNEWGSGTRARIRATTGFEAGTIRFKDHPNLETVFKGFEVDVNGRVANGIDVNTGFWQLMNGATKRIEDNIVHGVYSEANRGEYRYGIIVSNHGGTAGYAENVEIIDNVVYDISRDAICLYPGDENANTRIRNLLVRGNEAYGTGQDPGYCCGSGILIKGYVENAIVEYNYIHDVKGASIFVNSNESNHFGNGPTNVHLRHNILTNSTQNGAILVYDGSGGNDPKSLEIYGNIIYNSTVNAGLLLHGGLVGSISLRVYNNTFHNAPVRVENSSANYSNFEFSNNIVSFPSGLPLSDAGRKITTHSNNLFYRSSGTLVTSGGTSYSASTLNNYESSASSANPLFKSTSALPTGFSGAFGSSLAPSSDGLSLQNGSPAINGGRPLGNQYAMSINSVMRPAGSAWDIGAYEAGNGVGQEVRPNPPVDLQVD
jgi:hypothetical protein